MDYEERRNLLYLHIIIASLLFFTPIIHLPLTQNPYVPIKLTFLKILSVLTFAIWADLIIRKGEIKLSLNYIDFLIFGLLIIFGFSLVVSTSINYSKVELIRFIILFFLYITTKNLIKNRKLISVFAILSGFYVALTGILEYFKVINYKYTAITHGHGISSTIGNPNFLGEYLNIIFPLVASYFIFEEKKFKTLLYFVPLILIGIAILLTYSRAAFFTFLLGLSILIFLVLFLKKIERKKVIYFRCFSILVFFTLMFLVFTRKNIVNPNPYPLKERIFSTFDVKASSTKQRLYIWKISAYMIKEKLLTGYGLGTFAINFPAFQGKFLLNYKLEEDIVLPEQAHNEFISFFVETGILGFILFSLLPVFTLYYGLSFVFRKNGNNYPLSIGITIGCFSIFITSLVGFPFHINSSSSTFFILLGLLPVNSIKNLNVKFKLSETLGIILRFLVVIICVFLIARSSYLFICKYYQLKAKIFFSKKDIQKAIFTIEKAQKYGKNDDEVLYYNAKFNTAGGNLERASTLLEEAISIDKNNLNYYLLLCEIYTKRQLWDKLIESANYASFLDPKNALFYYFTGLAYYNKKMYNRAIPYFKRTIQLDKTHSESYLYMGICYNNLHNYDLSISSYKNCILTKKNYLCHYNLGNVYLQLKRYESAINEYKESIKMEPNYPLSHGNLGLLYFQLKRFDAAERELRKALKLAPNNELIKKKLEEILNVKSK